MTEEDTFEALKYRIVDEFGHKCFYNHDNQLHRVNGPAIENTNGYKAWWVNGQRHRVNGPACKWGSGHEEWWVNGKCHRTDGPAINRANGSKEWFLNGHQFTEAEFLAHPLCTIK